MLKSKPIGTRIAVIRKQLEQTPTAKLWLEQYTGIQLKDMRNEHILHGMHAIVSNLEPLAVKHDSIKELLIQFKSIPTTALKTHEKMQQLFKAKREETKLEWARNALVSVLGDDLTPSDKLETKTQIQKVFSVLRKTEKEKVIDFLRFHPESVNEFLFTSDLQPLTKLKSKYKTEVIRELNEKLAFIKANRGLSSVDKQIALLREKPINQNLNHLEMNVPAAVEDILDDRNPKEEHLWENKWEIQRLYNISRMRRAYHTLTKISLDSLYPLLLSHQQRKYLDKLKLNNKLFAEVEFNKKKTEVTIPLTTTDPFYVSLVFPDRREFLEKFRLWGSPTTRDQSVGTAALRVITNYFFNPSIVGQDSMKINIVKQTGGPLIEGIASYSASKSTPLSHYYDLTYIPGFQQLVPKTIIHETAHADQYRPLVAESVINEMMPRETIWPSSPERMIRDLYIEGMATFVEDFGQIKPKEEEYISQYNEKLTNFLQSPPSDLKDFSQSLKFLNYESGAAIASKIYNFFESQEVDNAEQRLNDLVQQRVESGEKKTKSEILAEESKRKEFREDETIQTLALQQLKEIQSWPEFIQCYLNACKATKQKPKIKFKLLKKFLTIAKLIDVYGLESYNYSKKEPLKRMELMMAAVHTLGPKNKRYNQIIKANPQNAMFFLTEGGAITSLFLDQILTNKFLSMDEKHRQIISNFVRINKPINIYTLAATSQLENINKLFSELGLPQLNPSYDYKLARKIEELLRKNWYTEYLNLLQYPNIFKTLINSLPKITYKDSVLLDVVTDKLKPQLAAHMKNFTNK